MGKNQLGNVGSRVLVLSITMIALVGGAARGMTVTTADGNGADAMIRGHGSAQASANFDGQGLGVHYVSLDLTDGMRKSYVRFDLSGVGDLNSLTDATFVLTLDGPIGNAGGTDTLQVWGLNDGYVGGADDNLDSALQFDTSTDPDVPDLGENWGESAINWYNAPGHDAGSAAESPRLPIPSLTQSLGTFDIDSTAASQGDTFSVGGADLVSFLQGDTNDLVTLFIAETSHDGQLMDFFPPPGPTNGWVFADKEHGQLAPPTLNLTLETTATVPEAATSTLALLGIVILLRRRRTA